MGWLRGIHKIYVFANLSVLTLKTPKRRYALWQGKACYKAYFCKFSHYERLNGGPEGNPEPACAPTHNITHRLSLRTQFKFQAI